MFSEPLCLLFRTGSLAAGLARHLLLGFAKQIVGDVVSLKLWQFAYRFALFFAVWKIIELAQSCDKIRQFRLGKRPFSADSSLSSMSSSDCIRKSR